MKKIIIVLSIVLTILCVNKNNKYEEETIRFRIIANSNSENDQKLKKEILNEISDDLINNNISNINDERKYLKSKIPRLEEKIKQFTKNYKVNYGDNYFPTKNYKGKKYKAGKYESLVITLGEGEGKNFWCILFPPLCIMDEEKNENIEYKSLIKEVINKFF